MAKNKNVDAILGTVFYECQQASCGKKFSSKKALNEHKRTHKSQRNFVCSICDQKFTQLSSLQKHGRVHDKKKPFVCDHEGCASAFTQVSNLIRHKRIHTGEKPYKCDKCNKRFASGSNLKQHKKTHDSFHSRKIYTCKFCVDTAEKGKTFLYQTSLRKHMQIYHKEEYDKLFTELEVDKSPIIARRKGKVFIIELIDKDSKITKKLKRMKQIKDEETMLKRNQPQGPFKSIWKKPSAQLLSPKAQYSGINRFPISSQTKDLKLNGVENASFIRQSSQLSEASQYMNPLVDFADNKFFNCETTKPDAFKAIVNQDSFMMGNRFIGKNSSFNSNGMFSKNNSFFHPGDAKFFDEDHKPSKFKSNDEHLGSFRFYPDKGASPPFPRDMSRVPVGIMNNAFFPVKDIKPLQNGGQPSPNYDEQNESFFKSNSFKIMNQKHE